MGNFYTNITLRTEDRTGVLHHLSRLGRRCFVSPCYGGFITVYDSLCDDQDLQILEGLTLDLSSKLRCSAVAVLNHDDDVLWLGVARTGHWITIYHSETILSGSVWRLAVELKAVGLYPLLWLLMRWPFVAFEILRHSAIAFAIGLPKFSVGFGYRYLSNGERPDGAREGDFEKM